MSRITFRTNGETVHAYKKDIEGKVGGVLGEVLGKGQHVVLSLERGWFPFKKQKLACKVLNSHDGAPKRDDTHHCSLRFRTYPTNGTITEKKNVGLKSFLL